MRWPASDHYANGRFFTPHAPTQLGLGALIQWLRHREKAAWGGRQSTPRGAPPPQRLASGQVRTTFINHSTVLLQVGELNIITDPIWSEFASPVQFAGPRRHCAPGIRFEDLPPIDLLLLSHNHYDHLDVPTLQRLQRRDAPTVYCPLGVARRVRRLGFHSIVELDWWQQQVFRGAAIHCVPAQHFSARGLFDRNRTLWCGWHIGAPEGGILFAGDTGMGPHFQQIADRLPAPRVALLPIGAYRPRWFMGPVHMGPEEAIEAHAILQPQASLPIHHGTFSLADDGETEPVEHLKSLLKDRPEQHWRFLKEGESWMVRLQTVDEPASLMEDGWSPQPPAT